MQSNFSFHGSLLIIAIFISIVSFVQTLRNFFATAAKLDQGSSKDFDIYYVGASLIERPLLQNF